MGHDQSYFSGITGVVVLLAWLAVSSDAMAAEAVLAQPSPAMAGIWPWLATAMVLLLLMGFSLQESARHGTAEIEQWMLNTTLGGGWVFVLFVLVGYGLTFGHSAWGLFGVDHFFRLDDAGMHQVFYGLLAAITVLLAGRALAGNVPYTVQFTAALLILPLYAVVCSWVWANGGSGWLAVRGFSDVAGSSLIHSVAAWIGLAGFLALRLTSQHAAEQEHQDHRLLGIGLMLSCAGWLGLSVGCAWFGAYSDVSSDILVMNTMLGACGGMIGTAVAGFLVNQRLTLASVAIGCVAGLVSISAGVATMQSSFAMFTGLMGGVIALFALMLLRETRLAAIAPLLAAHGLSGIWGTLAAGMFYRGDFFNPDRMLIQGMGILAIFTVVFITAWGCYTLMLKLFGSGVRSQS